MSSSALARPASISTLDNASSSITGGDRLTQTRSRSRSKKRAINSGPGEVRDVLNKLGLGNGKQGGSLLKASFPPLQRPNSQRYVLSRLVAVALSPNDTLFQGSHV